MISAPPAALHLDHFRFLIGKVLRRYVVLLVIVVLNNRSETP
jgi:hypothetical protein